MYRSCFFRYSKRLYSTDPLPTTIYSLATTFGRSAIAIIRVNGPGSTHVLKELSGRSPKVRQPMLTELRLPEKPSIILDQALVLFFKGPNSYTGDDLLELHLHGGPAIIKAVSSAIASLNSLQIPIRHAENGEFTRRAFYNGRMDLTQAEGINSIIDAETELQRRAAFASVNGHMRQLYDKWRERILKNESLLTALIDFSDDNGDIETSSHEIFQSVRNDISGLLLEVKDHLETLKRTEIINSGVKINFLGPPNAGKSTLFNLISQDDKAIVSDIPGTTRDVLETTIDIDGYKVIFGDTAGIRELDTTDVIELEGIKRAKQRAAASDVVLAVLPVNLVLTHDSSVTLVNQQIENLQKSGIKVIVVLNKIDLVPDESAITKIIQNYSSVYNTTVLPISCKDGTGVNLLVQQIINVCSDISGSSTFNELPISGSQRTKDFLTFDVLDGIERFLEYTDYNDVVLASAELERAADGIGKITGRGISVDEILGSVFQNFCIGK